MKTLPFLGVMALCAQLFAQYPPQRFWVAGRYDGNRIVVYFDTVQFKGTMSAQARKIAPPVASLFFDPVEIPASYVAKFLTKPGAQQFAIGDRFDLMLGNGTITTVKLTTLVGCETDEKVGNDSFVGALATVEPPGSLINTKGYYAVRRHLESQRSKRPGDLQPYAGLVDAPVRLDVETQMARLLTGRMQADATKAEQALAGGVAPALAAQSFQAADGSLRYYVRAVWRSGRESTTQLPYALGAWMSPVPTLHILALEKRTRGYGDFGLPELPNVVDLGGARTGAVLHISQDARADVLLVDYRDGASSKEMRLLQAIGTGE